MSAQPFGFAAHSKISVIRETEDIAAVCLDGEFDVTNVAALHDQIDRELADGNNLILDLSQATFIDSSIIHALCNAFHRCDDRDETVVLQLGTAPIVERALEICGVERVLPRAHDRQEAVRIVQQQAHVAQPKTFRALEAICCRREDLQH